MPPSVMDLQVNRIGGFFIWGLVVANDLNPFIVSGTWLLL